MTCTFSYSKPPHAGPPGVGSKHSPVDKQKNGLKRPDVQSLYHQLETTAPRDSAASATPPLVSSEGIWLPPANLVEPTKTRTQVLIIGAGIAGLAAARTLINSDYDVRVLEARDRIGGRIWSSNALGVPVDVGAAWGTGTREHPVLGAAKQHGQSNDLPSIVYDQDGRRLTDAELQSLADLRQDFLAYVKQCQQRPGDSSFLDAEADFADIRKLTALQRSGLRYVNRTFIEHEWAGSLEESSLAEYDQAFHGLRDGHSGGRDQERLLAELAKDIPIQKQCEVSRIDYTKTDVDVWTTTGIFSAPYVLITMPLGVLKSEKVLFRPALPQSKRTAIAGLRMGVFNKVFVRFDRVFWDTDCDRIGLLSNSVWDWPEIIPLQDRVGEPVLMAFSAGRTALCNEAMASEDVVDSLMSSLRKMYGSEIPNPISHTVSRWHADPHSLGSYSFVPTGSVNTLRAALAAPVAGRLFFAGEATSQPFPSTVHGAYLSGVRAAFEIRSRKIAPQTSMIS